MYAKGIAVPGTYPWCTQSRREAQVSQTKDFIYPLAGEGINPSAQHEAGDKSKQRYLERESVWGRTA